MERKTIADIFDPIEKGKARRRAEMLRWAAQNSQKPKPEPHKPVIIPRRAQI